MSEASRVLLGDVKKDKPVKTFVTYQPSSVLNYIEENGSYPAPANERLLNGIWCLEVNKDTYARVFLCAPAMPQVMIVFQSSDYEEIDYINWVNKLYLSLETSYDSPYKEYIVKSIDSGQIIHFDTMSTSDDLDEIQDDFMSDPQVYLKKLTNKKWRNRNSESFWSSPEAVSFVEHISLCVLPYRKLEPDDFSKALELVYTYFCKG